MDSIILRRYRICYFSRENGAVGCSLKRREWILSRIDNPRIHYSGALDISFTVRTTADETPHA
jgi:hypothetical protein